ncbi:Ferric enterobactin transport system permease protein FepD [Klebsiella pneumoniae]|nr:Ferric enterobactin transport system permease protein FepD [Klebsiella pneumoniae]
MALSVCVGGDGGDINFDEQTLLAMRTGWPATAGLNWSTLQTALIGLGVALLIAPRLNVLALGMALGLGVNLVRLLGLLAIALLCGAAVAVAGPIGFVGWWCRTWCAVW